MSISGVSGNSYDYRQNGQTLFQQIQSEFQQLGQDLQSGNLSQAQQDFTTLSSNLPGSNNDGELGLYPNPNGQPAFQQIQSEFQQLGQDLQTGNLSQAQQDFATLSSNLPGANNNGQSALQQIQSEFQQLGQDLQTGNLSQAQQDFAALSSNLPGAQQTGTSNTTGSTSGNPVSQALNSFQQDLQSGNLSAAQKDFSSLQQALQQQASQQQQGLQQQQASQQAEHGHGHRHHHGGDSQDGQNSQSGSSIAQEFSQLQTSLQSGNLSAAQSAYASLQQSLPWLTNSASATVPAQANGAQS